MAGNLAADGLIIANSSDILHSDKRYRYRQCDVKPTGDCPKTGLVYLKLHLLFNQDTTNKSRFTAKNSDLVVYNLNIPIKWLQKIGIYR